MKILTLITVLFFTNSLLLSQNETIVNHNIRVEIQPETSTIIATDTIEIFGEYKKEFLLNSSLLAVSKTKGVSFEKIADNVSAYDIGMDRDEENETEKISISKWKINGNSNKFVVFYMGKITSEIEQSTENYQRGFSQSAGIICDKGTYLAGSTYWTPTFENKLITFKLTSVLPKNWKNVTIGERLKIAEIADKNTDTWLCDKPQEEIFLIAANFTEYSQTMNNGTKAMAFLRTPDDAIATKYLEVTEQYMAMYEEMIGKYPYTKFALVENFWETGYGMPSFTLLGEKIIRFPFILHSSYPHELLHNWWGNSVYVDFKSGNWCEGTTAFMADHLIKEQRGEGEEYRRSTLQKYSNFVNPTNDFPLNKFQSRTDAATEAIGYGKALMLWQMLRQKLGDELFLKGIQTFYKNNIYKKASYADLQKSMEEVSGISLADFFTQWTTRIGAPKISIKNIKTDIFAGKHRIILTLEQQQAENAFNIDIPINIATEKGLETFVFNMSNKIQEYQIPVNSKPLKLVIDAQYDIFRILDPNEVPPSLSKIWASTDNLIILPKNAKPEQIELYKKFANQQKQADSKNRYVTIFDNELKAIPVNTTAWILGFENKYAGKINQELTNYNSQFLADSVKLEDTKLAKIGNQFVVTVFDNNYNNRQSIFLAFDNENSIDGLIRKLPHYGKYSYLAFNGNEPTNIAKGQWAVINSPLEKTFVDGSSKINVTEKRKALATLKPVFSENRMMNTIKFLSSESMKGRGLGTPELEKAAEYIAEQFKTAGLEQLNNSYYQKFTHNFPEKGNLNIINVIGIIKGSDPKLSEEPVVISAHYDHLGYGWPDVRKGNEGKIHFGADDNASGVSILIELAQTMAKTLKPKRTIVFIATSAEEAGLIGSRYFVAHKSDYFKSQIFANINLDTDGSLFDKKLIVLNANTAKEWKFIFMGTDYTTGIATEIIEKNLDASDQVAFIENKIPAIQLFTGATENYHRPSDTFDKIDSKGLVKVATVTKEVVEYLGNRTEAMNFIGISQNEITPQKTTETTRKASTGSVPDFSYKGNGVRIGSIIKNANGTDSGLRSGDIIIEINGNNVQDLKQYSDYLKQFKPNDTIKLKILREDKEQIIDLILQER